MLYHYVFFIKAMFQIKLLQKTYRNEIGKWKQTNISSVTAGESTVCLSRVQLFVSLGTVAHQASLYMGFSRQEYWSGLPFPLQRIFLTQGSNPGILALQADSLSCELQGSSKTKH